MRDQITEVSNQAATYRQASRTIENTASASYPDAAFWLQVYPPLSDRMAPLQHSRIICPWSMAAELGDIAVPLARRQNIMEVLKSGLKTIRQYNVSARRIVFTEDHLTRQISVWVD